MYRLREHQWELCYPYGDFEETAILYGARLNDIIYSTPNDIALPCSSLPSPQAEEYKNTSVTFAQERDFYYSKLRSIEVYLQGNTTEMADHVREILYATEVSQAPKLHSTPFLILRLRTEGIMMAHQSIFIGHHPYSPSV